MRKIIIEYYNNEYHIQFWMDGTLRHTRSSNFLREYPLVQWLELGEYKW